MDNDFDSPQAIREMNARHVRLGRRMQAVGLRALAELERKLAAGEISLSVEEAKALFDGGAKLRQAAALEDGDAPLSTEPSKSKPH